MTIFLFYGPLSLSLLSEVRKSSVEFSLSLHGHWIRQCRKEDIFDPSTEFLAPYFRPIVFKWTIWPIPRLSFSPHNLSPVGHCVDNRAERVLFVAVSQ